MNVVGLFGEVGLDDFGLGMVQERRADNDMVSIQTSLSLVSFLIKFNGTYNSCRNLRLKRWKSSFSTPLCGWWEARGVLPNNDKHWHQAPHLQNRALSKFSLKIPPYVVS